VLFRDEDIAVCHDYFPLFAKCSYTSLEIIRRGITEGRNGKGIIYLWALGNDCDFGSDVNTEGIVVNRYIIPVAATGKDDRSFSVGGAPLIVTGPGGEFDHHTNKSGAWAGGSSRDIGCDRSCCAPVIAGAAALIPEANPELTWRDVRGSLARRARKFTRLIRLG